MDNRIAFTIVASPEHNLPGHPENPRRFQHFHRLTEPPFSEQLLRVEPREDPVSAITSIHPPSYLEELEQAASRGPGFLDHGDTYVTPASYQAALEAVSGALSVVNAVIEGQATGGLALVRPPGHHTSATRPSGFCLLNNIAIATRYAQSHGYPRVAIVDFDVHHGNGTQALFEKDPSVLYISTHQYGIYPGTGSIQETGLGEGKGSVVNIPLPARAGDQAFEAVTEQVIEPITERFGPDILLISAGFDAHWNDPLASLQLSTTGYHQLGTSLLRMAKNLCENKIVYFLEGGYDPDDLWDNVLAILYSLKKEPMPADRLGPAPFAEANIENLIETLQSIHGLRPK
jgi:acetoin utilization deacetylase AcuC-like enzyme